MTQRLSMDAAGRIVLPKPVRERLQLEPGESLEIEPFDDYIVLKPIRAHTAMRKKQGIWVFQSGEPLKTSVVDETIRKVREEREDMFLGKKR